MYQATYCKCHKFGEATYRPTINHKSKGVSYSLTLKIHFKTAADAVAWAETEIRILELKNSD